MKDNEKEVVASSMLDLLSKTGERLNETELYDLVLVTEKRVGIIETRLDELEEYKQEIIDAVQMVESLGELTSYHKLCFPSGMNGTNLVNEVHGIDDRLTHLEEKVT